MKIEKKKKEKAREVYQGRKKERRMIPVLLDQ
jgi:hypothetical protein